MFCLQADDLTAAAQGESGPLVEDMGHHRESLEECRRFRSRLRTFDVYWVRFGWETVAHRANLLVKSSEVMCCMLRVPWTKKSVGTDARCVRNFASPKMRQECSPDQAKVNCTVCGWRYHFAALVRLALEDAM